MGATAALKKIVKNVVPYYFVEQYRKGKNAGQIDNARPNLKTSLSDNERYPDFCLKASNDMLVFSNFRQSEIYRQILEHVTPDIGRLYLEEIKRIRPDIMSRFDGIKENDIYGNPDLAEYADIGKISPSTLRYTKVAADLLNFFTSLDGLKIAEIGVGYGGQCRVINSIAKPAGYTLVDIKPALLLAQCFLDGFVLNSIMSYKTMNELSKDNYDLLISNYAFTELKREIQDVYLDKILLNSRCGYITYNEITPEYFRSYKREELLRIIPNSRIIDEVPQTGGGKNCIIIWGDRR